MTPVWFLPKDSNADGRIDFGEWLVDKKIKTMGHERRKVCL